MPDTPYEPFLPFSAWTSCRLLTDVWRQHVESFEGQRNLASAEAVERAVEVATRMAALETGAIEGLYATTRGVTRAVALQGAMWEAALDELGADVRGHFDAQLEAFDLVMDAVTGARPVTEKMIREIHATACAKQATYRVLTPVGWQDRALHHGHYKAEPNDVALPDGGRHSYAPPEEVAPEMARLVAELGAPSLEGAPAVLAASYAHHALAAIHPFSDGNGRTARGVASIYLYRSAGVPLVIFSDQQEGYWDALIAADQGSPQRFVTFIEDRATDTLAMVTNRLADANAPLRGQGERLRQAFRSHGDLSHAEVQAVGARLTELVQRGLDAAIAEADLPVDIVPSYTPRHGRQQCTFWDEPYKVLREGGAFVLTLQTAEPVQVAVEVTPHVGVADESANRFAFIVIDANRGVSRLHLRVEDLHPAVSAAAETQINDWARNALRAALTDVEFHVKSALHQQGF